MRYNPFQVGWTQFGQYGLRLAFGASTTGQGAVPATAIRQRDSAVIRDRAGSIIQVRS